MRVRRSSAWRVEIFVVLGLIAALGILAAPLPFTGDQALFASGARQLAHGDVLYRDFWDVKQPGIYLFYLGGGQVFGYSEIALHLVEVGYQVLFATVLIVTLPHTFRHRWIGPLVALFVVGTYYATVEPVELGQVESLVGLPLYLTVWCSIRALGGVPLGTLQAAARGQRRKRLRYQMLWLFGSGLAGGAVVVLKLVVAPIVVAVWLLTAWEVLRASPGHRIRSFTSATVAVTAGFAIPVAAVVTYLAVHGQLGTARWTYFSVAEQTTGIAGRPLSRLLEGGFNSGARWALPLALALVGLVTAARRGWDRLELRLMVWLVVGIPVFLVQHWWIYTFLMFLTPVGIFAGYGLESIVDSWSRWRRPVHAVAIALALVLLVPVAVRVARNGHDVARNDFALTAQGRAQLQRELEPNYTHARESAAWLRRSDPHGDGVYVLGNPLDLYLADRRQSVAVNGWSPQQYPQSVWARLRTELVAARPDDLVVDETIDTIMRVRSPATLKLIGERYVRVGGAGPDGWYRLRPGLPVTR
jgi:hypothetical protein